MAECKLQERICVVIWCGREQGTWRPESPGRRRHGDSGDSGDNIAIIKQGPT